MRRLLALPLLFALGSVAHAQEDGFDGAQDNLPAQQAYQQDDVPPAESSAAPAKNAESDRRFDDIMLQNNVTLTPPAPASPVVERAISAPGFDARVVVPLDRYSEVRDQVKRAREAAARPSGPPVVLGGAVYSGEARQGALALKLSLQVTLGRPGHWKAVPLVGDDVVLVSASDGKGPLPVSRQNGYQVWITDRSGEVPLQIELLVPARGPRGSIEYDFNVPRTPVTTFRCRFPLAGLEPRLDAAVRSEISAAGGGTVLDATLRPTTRIHLVGFRDLGDGDGRRAKVYAESLNLVSIDEGSLDVFTVIRYTILYGGAKDFHVLVPAGMTVVSADGEGAFRYVLEKSAEGTLLRGETAFPIRSAYEISLRLHREISKRGTGETFDAPLPRCQGVEREQGWLGVEVPGKLRLEEEKKSDVLAVDVRQLPPEMVESAVSPILKAYRYHAAGASVRLAATRLPEKDPASASVDKVRAVTVVSPEGKLLTDLRITLRNRLRPALSLAVPDGVEVLSTLIDGQPVKPSKSEDGKLVLPLRRSAGGDRPAPFTIQIVTEGKTRAMGMLGVPAMRLPALDLPISSLGWSVFLPARNVYTALRGDVEAEIFSGEGSWHQATATAPAAGPVDHGGRTGGLATANAGVAASADTGAMPVRIKLPETGVRLEYSRYWIESGTPVAVSFWYLRSWLLTPAWILLAAVLAGGILLFSSGFTPSLTGTRPAAGAAIALGVLWPLHRLGGAGAVAFGILLGAWLVAQRRGWLRTTPTKVVDWLRALPAAYEARERAPFRFRRAAWRLLLGGVMFSFALVLLEAATQLLRLLSNPLGG